MGRLAAAADPLHGNARFSRAVPSPPRAYLPEHYGPRHQRHDRQREYFLETGSHAASRYVAMPASQARPDM